MQIRLVQTETGEIQAERILPEDEAMREIMSHAERFAAAFRQQFRGSFDAYTALKNERLFLVRPTFIERWIYRDAVPYIERFDIEHQQYSLAAYQGE